VQWPDDLRFLHITDTSMSNAETAKNLAVFVPKTVRVLQVRKDFFSISGGGTEVKQWPSGAVSLWRKERLQECGCDDYSVWYKRL
jgi:hypothetical protein